MLPTWEVELQRLAVTQQRPMRQQSAWLAARPPAAQSAAWLPAPCAAYAVPPGRAPRPPSCALLPWPLSCVDVNWVQVAELDGSNDKAISIIACHEACPSMLISASLSCRALVKTELTDLKFGHQIILCWCSWWRTGISPCMVTGACVMTNQ